jgi:predicted pyridoxine 5'-phosphate oxidase superfamily flavin-nucleotide-binding protein
MVKFTKEMKDALRVPGKGGSLIYLCTSSRGGNPNIAAMRFVATHMDDKILIADMFLLKTKANIKENPNVAVTICHPLDEEQGRAAG